MWVKRNEKNEIIESRSHKENGCNEWLEENNEELINFLNPLKEVI